VVRTANEMAREAWELRALLDASRGTREAS